MYIILGSQEEGGYRLWGWKAAVCVGKNESSPGWVPKRKERECGWIYGFFLPASGQALGWEAWKPGKGSGTEEKRGFLLISLGTGWDFKSSQRNNQQGASRWQAAMIKGDSQRKRGWVSSSSSQPRPSSVQHWATLAISVFILWQCVITGNSSVTV